MVFPIADFLPQQKLKELERYLPERMESDKANSMDNDLYICVDLEEHELRKRWCQNGRDF